MSIWTNWDPLEEVIVGNCPDASNPSWNLDPRAKILFDEILKETKEDLDNLSSLLTSLNVKVFRPKIINHEQEISLGNFKVTNATYPIVPRDQYLVHGNTIFQTYTSMPDRYVDSTSYYEIFKHLYDEGYNWISQPPPILWNFEEQSKWFNEPEIYSKKYKELILWHAATMFKCGDALITNNLGPGTQLGLEWMRRNTDVEIIKNNGTVVDNWGHIDHGFYMTDDETVFCMNKDWVPQRLRHLNLIPINKLYNEPYFDYQGYMEKYKNSKGRLTVEWLEGWIQEWKGFSQQCVFESNNLVVDSKNIIFSIEQPQVFELMARMGINAHVCKIRHGLFWEAGIHCLTLDIKRKGSKRRIVNNIP